MVLHLAKKFPKSTFWNCDLNTKASEIGTAEVHKCGLQNVFFHNEDACALPESWSDKFSYILMIDFLHDAPFPVKACQEAYRVLKPGCFMSVVDIDVSSDNRVTAKENLNPEIYAFSLFFCLSQSLATEGSAGLGTAAGVQKLMSILNEASFHDVKHLKVTQNCHLLSHKSASQ